MTAEANVLELSERHVPPERRDLAGPVRMRGRWAAVGPVGAPRGEPGGRRALRRLGFFIDLCRVSKTRPKRNAVDNMAGTSHSTAIQTLGLIGKATVKTHRPAISCPLVSLTEKIGLQRPGCNNQILMCTSSQLIDCR
jgi:hypothetical protein